MMQNQGGYGQAPGGYGPPPQGGFGGGAPQSGAHYQVLTIDVSCFSGTIDHNKIAELSNDMASRGYTLDKLFVDVRTIFGPFCMKRCAVLVFKRG